MTVALLLPILVHPPRGQAAAKKEAGAGPLDAEEVIDYGFSSTATLGCVIFGIAVKSFGPWRGLRARSHTARSGCATQTLFLVRQLSSA